MAKTMGATPEIDEATTVKLTFDGCPFVTMYPGQSVVSDPVAFPLEDTFIWRRRATATTSRWR